ncbi:MAG TPA: hypothetical protein VFM56_12715 [Solimonas sp.]|nr:hypothetical protein [Solimonas sp.]
MRSTETRPKLIGLYSPAPQSGKSTAAGFLRERGYRALSFAGPLKRMISSLLLDAGFSRDERSHALYGDLKETPIPLFGKSPREMLQTLGTEWGRGLVKQSIWTDIAMLQAQKSESPVVFDDMRFPNEFDAIKQAGGVCICIVRPGAEHSSGHASEGALNGHGFDAYIANTGTVEDLKRKLDNALETLERHTEDRAAESRPDVAESATPRGEHPFLHALGRLERLREYESAGRVLILRNGDPLVPASEDGRRFVVTGFKGETVPTSTPLDASESETERVFKLGSAMALVAKLVSDLRADGSHAEADKVTAFINGEREPEPNQPFRITGPGRYRTRDGATASVDICDPDSAWPWKGRVGEPAYLCSWTESGASWIRMHHDDIVAGPL